MRLFGGYGSNSLPSLAPCAARPVALPSNARANSATGTNRYARVSSAQYCCVDRQHFRSPPLAESQDSRTSRPCFSVAKGRVPLERMQQS